LEKPSNNSNANSSRVSNVKKDDVPKSNNQAQSFSNSNQSPSTNRINLPFSEDSNYQIVREAMNKGLIPEDPYVSGYTPNNPQKRIPLKIIGIQKDEGLLVVRDVDGNISTISGKNLEKIRKSETSREKFEAQPSKSASKKSGEESIREDFEEYSKPEEESINDYLEDFAEQINDSFQDVYDEHY
jgi:hypothetical protein